MKVHNHKKTAYCLSLRTSIPVNIACCTLPSAS